ncbi:MAG: hypothetical protein Q9160_008660 [Pyrenula sp. 1 TL-2023]
MNPRNENPWFRPPENAAWDAFTHRRFAKAAFFRRRPLVEEVPPPQPGPQLDPLLLDLLSPESFTGQRSSPSELDLGDGETMSESTWPDFDPHGSRLEDSALLEVLVPGSGPRPQERPTIEEVDDTAYGKVTPPSSPDQGD